MKYAQSLKSVFLWKDRQRVFHQISEVPIPLLISSVQQNRTESVQLLRLILDKLYNLPVDFVHAAIAFGVEPSQKEVVFRKKSTEEKPPAPFEHRDLYWKDIAMNDPRVANDIREYSEDIPKGLKKKKEAVSEWI